MRSMIAEWKKCQDDVVFLMINTEGDSDLSASTGFAKKLSLEGISHPNYVHGAFVGGEPKAFNQFNMEYIPHMSALSKTGLLLGNRVKPADKALELCKNSLV